MIIRQLLYLDALAREKHFRRAAEACHVSQPTLSAAIVQLEEELGVLIVERGRRFQGFTKEGEAVLARARRILAEADLMKEEIAELREGISGRIRLGAIPTALPMIAHITAPFSERYPAVSLTVLSLTSQEIQEGIDNFELDVGLTYLDNEPLGRVSAVPLYYEEYRLLTAASGLLGDREEVTWAEVGAVPLCLLTPDMQNRRIIDDMLRRAGTEPAPMLESNSVIVLFAHVRTSQWASIMPAKLAETLGLTDSVRAIPIVDPVARHAIGLVVPNRDQTTPLIKALVAEARDVAVRLGA